MVKIRMKLMGRTHRRFFRIVAIDSRQPRDGKVIEELGTYDPSIVDTSSRVIINKERAEYWLGVGAQPTEKTAALMKRSGVELPVKKKRERKRKTATKGK